MLGLAAALLAAPLAHASAAWQEVLRFHAVDGSLPYVLSRKLKQEAGDELAAFTLAAFEEAEVPETLINLLAQRMDMRLSAATLADYQRFMATPAGKRLGELARKYPEPSSFVAAVDAEPAPLRASIGRFLEGPAATEVVAFLGSEETNTLAKEIGLSAACRHVGRELPLEYEVMVALRHCVHTGEGPGVWAPAGRRASESVVELLYSGEQMRRLLVAKVEESQDSELKRLSLRVLEEDFDSRVLIGLFGRGLEEKVAAADIDALAAFANTETGKQLSRIVRETPAKSLETVLRQQPPDFQRRLAILYQSKPWQPAMNTLLGDSSGEVMFRYTTDLVCGRARRDDPALLARLVSSGRCPAVAPGT